MAPPRSVEASVAEPLVLLPGMLGDETVWDDVRAHLDGGLVRTARIDGDDSVAGLAAAVLAQSPPWFALAGHSLGGIVALEVVRQAPHRVTRLALLTTGGRAASAAQLAGWAELGRRVGAGEFDAVARELAVANLPAHRRDDDTLVRRCERMAYTVGPEGLLRQLDAQATRPDSRPDLARMPVPALVLTGAADHVAPRALQEELAAWLPRAVHVTLDGTGHMAPLEDPRAVAAALGTWLARS